jgi:hypothetical protein
VGETERQMKEFIATPEQKTVIDAGPNEKLLVLAGAGTGKTETLVRRIDHLLTNTELQHGDILVLTYSRAAVRELRKRLRERESVTTFVRARTFDSFSTRLLMHCKEAGDLSGKGYEDRIRLAAQFITTDSDAKTHLSDYRHVIVDEMQDLVGSRQELVRSLLDHLKAFGFTLFSDPAQSIYDYQVRRDRNPLTAARMLEWLRDRFGRHLRTIVFNKDFRFETDEARTALWAREQLIQPEPNYEIIRDRLKGDLRSLHTFTLNERVPGIRRSADRLAILCRKNAHALVLSRELHRYGIPHAVQRDQNDRCLPPWLAVVLRGCEDAQLQRSEFLDRCAAAPVEYRPEEAERTWDVLRRAAGGRGTSIHLGTLNERFRMGSAPEELIQPVSGNIILSTVHRAKGLEFTHVMVADPEQNGATSGKEDIAEEARILYVALTRARRRLERLAGPDHCYVGNDKNDRCRSYVRRNGFALAKGIEVCGTDCHAMDPAGAFGFSADVLATQQYIQNSVHPGDLVSLQKTQLEDPESGETRVHYVILHNLNPVGITSVDAFWNFKDALWPPKAYGKFKISWPKSMEGVHVEVVDTVAGLPATSRKYGLGHAGLWLRVRVAGLSDLRF